MIADMMPHTGGAPEVMAIPIEKGSEIMATMNPLRKSCRQCFRPASPFWGFAFWPLLVAECALLIMVGLSLIRP
ncbi:MAG: hypothetical protein AB7O59_03180 [Pirellulales bacterium]